MSDATQLLEQLGFSEYEARAYIALLRRNPLNGYELAKESGIPRPNIYAVLQKLQERQAVVPLATGSGTRYAPLPPDRLTARLGGQFNQVLAAAHQSLSAVAEAREDDYLWNVQGYDLMLERTRALVDEASSHLIIALWATESIALADATGAAAARGVQMTTLCLQACPERCGACREQLFRYRVTPEPRHRWLIVVADEAELLFAEIRADATVAMQTRQPHLIHLAGWFVRHSIALAAIVDDLGDDLERTLDPETRALLNAVGPDHDGDWLSYMRQLLGSA